MVSNPFARDPAVSVGVGADTSAFSGAMDGAIGKLGSFKGAVAGVGVALGALAVGGLAKATQAAADFEQQMVEVEKVTNPATARRMGNAIKDMASKMPMAHQELAEITAAAGRLGVSGEQDLRRFTRVTSEMAIATDLAAQEAATSFAKMSTLMGEPISNVRSIGDAINALSNTMAASSSEIVDAATRSSGVLTQLGLSSDQILGLNAAMNEVSSSARIAGTQLRRFGQEIQDPKKVKDLSAALDMTTSEFKAMRKNNPNKLIKTMARRFGQGGAAADKLRSTLSTTSRQTLAGLSQNLKSLNTAQKTANQQFREGGSLAREYESASSTFNSKVQVMKNRLHNVAIEIGTNLLPVMSRLLGFINRGIKGFSTLNAKTGGMAGTFTLVATALGGFTVALGSAISMVGGMTAVLGGLGTALGVLSGPIGVAVLAVAGLAAAWQSNFMNIQGRTRAFVSFLRGAMNRLQKNIINPFLSWMSAMWTQHFSGIAAEVRKTAAVWQSTIAGFVQWARPYVQGFLNLMGAAWSKWGDEITAVTRFAFNAIKGFIEYTLDVIGTSIRVMLRVLRGDWKGAWTLIKEFTIRTLTGIQNFARAWGGRFLSWVGGLVDGVVGWFRNLYRRLIGGSIIPNMFNSILSYARGWGSRFMGWLRNLVSNIINRFRRLSSRLANAIIPNMFSSILGTARRKGSDLVRSVRRTVSDMIRSTQRGMDQMVSAVWSRLSQFRSAVDGVVGAGRRAVTSKISAFRGAGSRLGSGIASGIRSRISSIRDAARDAMSAAKSYLPGSDADRGPLSDLTASGEALSETFASGIRNSSNEIGSALSDTRHTQDYTDYGSVTRTRSGDRTENNFEINVDASEGADGHQIGRDIDDELRSRGFGN